MELEPDEEAKDGEERLAEVFCGSCWTRAARCGGGGPGVEQAGRMGGARAEPPPSLRGAG
eukprot:363917-Chlamydomonas_euryale.AAC.7